MNKSIFSNCNNNDDYYKKINKLASCYDKINKCACYKCPIGIIGPTGPTGPVGGPTGPTGPQGVPGEVGATGTSDISGMFLVDTTTINSVLTVRNPAALTITPLAGGTEPVSAHLVIVQIQ